MLNVTCVPNKDLEESDICRKCCKKIVEQNISCEATLLHMTKLLQSSWKAVICQEKPRESQELEWWPQFTPQSERRGLPEAVAARNRLRAVEVICPKKKKKSESQEFVGGPNSHLDQNGEGYQ